MSRVFFEEKQKLPEWLGWIVVFTGAGMCFPLFRQLYSQMILQEPRGDDSPGDTAMILIILMVIVFVGFAAWMVFSQYMELKIDEDGIFVRNFPHQRVRKFEKERIVHYEIRKISFREKQMARRARKLGQRGEKQIYRMSGSMILELQLTGDVKTILLGTQNPDGLLWAMKKLLSNRS